MRALSASDHLFLLLENAKQPMHVAGTCIFELPDDAPADFISQLIKDMRMDEIAPSFPFNQRLHRKFYWKTDENFKAQQHFYHVSLPAPADMGTLFDYVSGVHSRILARNRPLWELHLIEGLAPVAVGRPARFALFLKIHHALADGVAAMRLFNHMLSTSPKERLSLPIWALTTKQRNQIDALLPKQSSALGIARTQLASLKPVGKELIARYRDRHHSSFTSSHDAPPSLLNQRIRTTRRLLGCAFDKSRFERIARHLGVTTNDVILATCAGALRSYLLSQDALPSKPLIAFVPISLRRDGSAVGNQLSFLLTNLATHQHSALTRLRTIAASINDGKARFSRMNQAQIINYSVCVYGMAGLNLATGLYPERQSFNLIISNVPGAKHALYLNGARLTGLFPASVLFDGQALNITLANYQDKIDFGITACDVALPDIHKLPHYLENALSELEALLTSRTA